MASVRIVFRLGSRTRNLPSPARPLRPATLVACRECIRGDRGRVTHAADRMAKRGGGDPQSQACRSPGSPRARVRLRTGHPEARENRGPVSDETETPPGFLPPSAEPIGRRPHSLLRSTDVVRADLLAQEGVGAETADSILLY